MFTLGISTTFPVLLSSYSCFILHIHIQMWNIPVQQPKIMISRIMQYVASHSELLLFCLPKRKHILYEYERTFCEQTARCHLYRSTTWMCHVAQPKCRRIRKLVSHRIIMFPSVAHSMERKVIRRLK